MFIQIISGGYGTVYKGEWKHQFVAVKRFQAKKDTGREVSRFIETYYNE